MSPEEVELLQSAGSEILVNVGALATECVLYGLYLTLYGFGIRALFVGRRGAVSRSTWILFGVLVVIFINVTLGFAVNLAQNLLIIRGFFIDNPTKPLGQRFDIADVNVIPLGIVDDLTSTTGGILFALTDTILVWRVWVLWPNNKLIQASLLGLMFGDFATSITASVVDMLYALGIDVPNTSFLSAKMIIASTCLSIATNLISTVLFGIKSHQHRQRLKIDIGVPSSGSITVLLFLTESGFVFCALQIIYAVLTLVTTSSLVLEIVWTIYVRVVIIATAAYPIFVTLIVRKKLSLADRSQASTMVNSRSSLPVIDIRASQSYLKRDSILFRHSASRYSVATVNGPDLDGSWDQKYDSEQTIIFESHSPKDCECGMQHGRKEPFSSF